MVRKARKTKDALTPRILEKRKIALVGLDFYGDPFKDAAGWSEENEIGRLWQRFENYYEQERVSVKHKVSDSGYELWVDFEGEETTKERYIFVGVEVEKVEDIPLEFVAKTLPETRYAVFTLKGEKIKSNWSEDIYKKWLPEAGLKTSHEYLIECYDPKRFKGPADPNSELDILVPIE
jgi:AraC family transcriptional regulator